MLRKSALLGRSIDAGIHFRSAVEDGIKQGRKIGRFAFTHTMRRLNGDDGDEDDDDR